MKDSSPAEHRENDKGLESLISVTVVGSKMNVSNDVTESIALEVINLILGGKSKTKNQSATDAPSNSPGVDDNLDLTIGEYMDARDAKTIYEKITAIGWFVMKTKDKKSFTAAEVMEQMVIARETKPTNISRDIKATVRKKWISSISKGEYSVTKTGSTAIAEKFSNETRRAKSAPRRKKVATKKKKSSASKTKGTSNKV